MVFQQILHAILDYFLSLFHQVSLTPRLQLTPLMYFPGPKQRIWLEIIRSQGTTCAGNLVFWETPLTTIPERPHDARADTAPEEAQAAPTLQPTDRMDRHDTHDAVVHPPQVHPRRYDISST